MQGILNIHIKNLALEALAQAPTVKYMDNNMIVQTKQDVM